MITKEEALLLTHGAVVHAGECKRIIGPRGGVTERIEQWRISGKATTWVTRPDHFSVPIKYGMYASATLNHSNCKSFHLAGDCPVRERLVAERRKLLMHEITVVAGQQLYDDSGNRFTVTRVDVEGAWGIRA